MPIGVAGVGAFELSRTGRELGVYLWLANVGGTVIGVVGLGLLAHVFE